MRIDSKSATPVYQQIVEGMQSAIAAGVYRVGEEVPSTRSLAMELHVNPNTVQKAYEELVRNGVLESRRGLGKVVAAAGESSAIQQSEKSVRAAFVNGVELARSAQLGNVRIREILDEVIKANPKRATA